MFPYSIAVIWSLMKVSELSCMESKKCDKEDRGRFEIFLAATPEYSRIIVLDPEKTRG